MRKIKPALKGLIVSGFVSEEINAQIADSELVGTIVKPYQLDNVLKKISEIIALR
jgi:hypothetical protein